MEEKLVDFLCQIRIRRCRGPFQREKSGEAKRSRCFGEEISKNGFGKTNEGGWAEKNRGIKKQNEMAT